MSSRALLIILKLRFTLAQSDADIVGALKFRRIELTNLFAAFLDGDQDQNVIRCNGTSTRPERSSSSVPGCLRVHGRSSPPVRAPACRCASVGNGRLVQFVHGLHRRSFRRRKFHGHRDSKACWRRQAFSRSGVMLMLPTTTSNLPARRPAMMPSKAMVTTTGTHQALGNFGADIDVETDHLVLTINKTEWRENLLMPMRSSPLCLTFSRSSAPAGEQHPAPTPAAMTKTEGFFISFPLSDRVAITGDTRSERPAGRSLSRSSTPDGRRQIS